VNHLFAQPRSNYQQRNGKRIIDEGIKKGSLVRQFALFLSKMILNFKSCVVLMLVKGRQANCKISEELGLHTGDFRLKLREGTE
jgi:hypothetical protein